MAGQSGSTQIEQPWPPVTCLFPEILAAFGSAILCWLLMAAPLAAAVVESPATTSARPIDFSKDIQPLLAKRCFACHGPNTSEGGLRLDEQAGATAELESGGRAIIPKNIAASLIVARITSTDPDLQMPPEGARLKPSQVDAVKQWVQQGAEWKEHWAFRSIVRPAVPITSPASVNPVDAFVRNGLKQVGLDPPTKANKTTLLRRATYDLTGLAPTQDDVREFLADTSTDAWEKVIDRLLASPHYGEKWARHWLDLVRYADTNSFERDGDKPHAWRYRDYCIRSFNSDKPFDQFTIEQIAGDELPKQTPDALIATGYYRLGLWDDEPADRLQARFDWLDDIVATTGQAFLGLTVNCARCHDHKIDPIPQKDYYSLLSFFHNITPMANDGQQIVRPIFDNDSDRALHDEQFATLQRQRNEAQKGVSELENQFKTAWEKVNTKTSQSGDIDDLEFRFYRDSWTRLPVFDDIKPEDVGPVPSQLFDITVAPSLRPSDFGYVFVGFLKVPTDADYTFTLDSDDGTRLLIDGREVILYDGVHGEGASKTATISLQSGRLPIRLEYFQGGGGKGLSLAWSGPGFTSRTLSAAGQNGLEKAGQLGFRLADAIKRDGEKILGVDGKREYDGRVALLDRLKKENVPVGNALVVTEHGANPPETFLLYRGNPHLPRDKVLPAFPSILKAKLPEIPTPLPGAKTTGRRMALAQWLVSADNPLTARVIVNRIWQYHFGRGIVRSASNFGMMGDPPTQPELLDWLASELVAGNWRFKPMHKLLMMSDTYQAASTANPQALTQDPLNDSLWRFDMRRLSAEEVFDSIHMTSGALNPKMYGPGIYPKISAQVMAGQSQPGKGWGNTPLEEQSRRSIYIHVKRSLITPILADFDFADTDSSCPVRFATTQPTQALGMLNGDFTHEQARVFAARIRREAGGPTGSDLSAQVRLALELALTRSVGEAEITKGVQLIEKLSQQEGVSRDRAMELYCLMILNLNEFTYLD